MSIIMQTSVSGKQIAIGAALQEHVKERLTKAVTKYFDRAINADVVFSKEAHLFRADLLVNEGTGTGIIIKATAAASEIYEAFDTALIRIEKQLRRYKRRIKNHHKPKPADMVLEAKKYVISHAGEEEEGAEEMPLIIAEKVTQIEKLTVSEAVMRMDLQQLPALLFINIANGRLNVVYNRADGNISWVDPEGLI